MTEIPPTRRGRIISPDLPGFNPRRGRRLTVKGLIPFSSGDNGRTRRRGCVCFAPVPRLVSSGSGGLSVPPRGPSSVSSIGAAALRPPLLVSDTLTSAEISATGGRRRFVPSGRLLLRRSVSRPASFGPGWFRPSRPLGPIPRAGRSLFPAPSMGARVGANRVRSRLRSGCLPGSGSGADPVSAGEKKTAGDFLRRPFVLLYFRLIL